MGVVMIRLWIALLTLLALAGTARAEPVLDPEEHTLWVLINDYRKDHGVQPVGLNDQLVAAAEWMSNDMAANDYFSHTDSLNRDPQQRMIDHGYFAEKTTTGENLAAGMDTAQAAFDAWKGSPEHDANMLSKYFWAVGIARAGEYWTVNLGGRGPAWFPPTPTPVLAATATPSPTATLGPTPTPSPNGLPYTGSP